MGIAFAAEIVLEERQLDVFAVEGRSGGAEIDVAEPLPAGARPAAMAPRADDYHVENAGVLLLNRIIRFERAVEVLGVVPSADGHHGRGHVLEVWQKITRLPEFVVVGMLHHLVPEANFAVEIASVGVLERTQVEEELVAVRRAVPPES